MKKSTFRIIKSIGLFLFLLLFGVFIYVLIKDRAPKQQEISLSKDPELLDANSEVSSTERVRIGFEYEKSATNRLT